MTTWNICLSGPFSSSPQGVGSSKFGFMSNVLFDWCKESGHCSTYSRGRRYWSLLLYVVQSRHGTISNFGSISISIFSQISSSISRSISILYLEKNQYQDQYQYQYFSKPNIKIKINNFKNLTSTSIPASISSIYWYWYWKSIFY